MRRIYRGEYINCNNVDNIDVDNNNVDNNNVDKQLFTVM
jgi:hypothetical protein